MADKLLFPVFELQEDDVEETIKQLLSPRSPCFDFETGDFKQDGGRIASADATEAYIQWCLKTVLTERCSCLSYGKDYGTEMEAALSLTDPDEVESAVEKTITDALQVDVRTEFVSDFEFIWQENTLYCSFVVKGVNMEAKPVALSLSKD